MRSLSHSESAFTTDTPTPCNPPETLYEFWSNLPPACNSVITISAAERLRSSSSLMSVGMPRPLSTTEMELSVWITTLMSSQWPASASSMALSTTSNTMWCRPVPSEVSPMYIPGRLRTASSPFSTLMLSESYWSRGGSFFSASDIYSLLVQIRIGITTYLKSSRPGRVNSALELASPNPHSTSATSRLLSTSTR